MKMEIYVEKRAVVLGYCRTRSCVLAEQGTQLVDHCTLVGYLDMWVVVLSTFELLGTHEWLNVGMQDKDSYTPLGNESRCHWGPQQPQLGRVLQPHQAEGQELTQVEE